MLRDAKDVVIVDPGESEICESYIRKYRLQLRAFLITHHHSDHIDGIVKLKTLHPEAQVFGPLKNKEQIPLISEFVKQGQSIQIGSFHFSVLELPGHTLGIVGYYEHRHHWLFSGDVVFGLGCGRLFEGTAEMLFASLQKIKTLPQKTLIFCTHEYTSTNLRFVEKLIEENKMPKKFQHEKFLKHRAAILTLREQNRPTVPLLLETEMACNPFLLSETVEQLAELRQLRNHFS